MKFNSNLTKWRKKKPVNFQLTNSLTEVSVTADMLKVERMLKEPFWTGLQTRGHADS